jgi:hypothetical protein
MQLCFFTYVWQKHKLDTRFVSSFENSAAKPQKLEVVYLKFETHIQFIKI